MSSGIMLGSPTVKLAVLCGILLLAIGCATETLPDSTETAQALEATATPQPTFTPYPTYTPFPAFTALPLATPAPTTTLVPTVTPTPTLKPEPTAMVTPAPTLKPKPTAMVTPAPTLMPEPTAMVTPAPTLMPEPTAMVTPAPTLMPEPTAMVTPTPTVKPEPTAMATPAPTVKPEPMATPLPTLGPRPAVTPTPATADQYEIETVVGEHGYTIDLSDDWTESREGQYDRSNPWGILRIISGDVAPDESLQEYAESTRDNLEQEVRIRWPSFSLFELTSFEEVDVDGQSFYSITYREQESPEHCVVDVAMRIAVSGSATAIPSAFRVSYFMCEEEAADHAQERTDILNSFRIVTRPSQYYKQALRVNGVLSKATGKVDRNVMYMAADIVKWMLGGRQEIVDCIAGAGSSIAVILKDEYITTLPDFAHLKGRADHIGRKFDSFESRGTGATKEQRVSAFGEETLGHPPKDIGLLVHEFAHAIDGLCFGEPEHGGWEGFYNEAVQSDRYPGEYLMSNRYEFFAVYSASYFGVTDEAGDRRTSRHRLSVDFPDIFQSLQEIYGTPAPYVDLPSLEPKIALSSVDRVALAALYNATDGANWANNDNWLSDAPAGKWYGVTVNPSGRVTALDLRSNELRGKIPAELGSLAELEALSLADNRLSGELPVELSNLSELNLLHLSSNQLTGEIPAQLGRLSNLTSLGLWSNRLTGEIPSELAKLANLESFAVADNRLSGAIPAWLANLHNLRELQMGVNRFSGPVPSWLGNLPLRRLLLSDNRLTGEIPDELGRLTDLEAFWIAGNKLTGCVPAGLRTAADNDFNRLGLPDCAGE